MSLRNTCTNCWTGTIKNNVCKDCGQDYSASVMKMDRRPKQVREHLPSRDDRKQMRKAEEKLGYDPFMTSIKN